MKNDGPPVAERKKNMNALLYRSLVMLAFWGIAGILVFVIQDSLHAAESPAGRTVFYPEESDRVLANPFMGFAVDAKYDESAQPFRLAHVNLTWRELEPEKGRYAFDAIEEKFNFPLWRQRGVHLIVRVIMDYPRDYAHMDIPDWLYREIGGDGTWYDNEYGKGFSPNYDNSLLIRNHERMISALGRRYNDDPLIAFIQLGSLGHWGEWHTWDKKEGYIPFPKRNVSDRYAEHYVRAFPDKHLLMRRPHDVALRNGMGLFNDAFGDPKATADGFYTWYTQGYTSWLTKEKEPAMLNFWTKAPSGGEFAHRTKYFQDDSIGETLRQARLTHVSWMGPNAPYLEEDRTLQPNIDRFLNTIGYRFVIVKESHEKKAPAGGKLNVRLDIRNRGVAPFYYPWPLELSLSDAATGAIVLKTVADADIRQWLPGTRTVFHTIKLPKRLAEGEYIVNAAILDPQTGKPGVEFAIEGRRPDGRYPLGTVIVAAPS